jgi:hypothetical protein
MEAAAVFFIIRVIQQEIPCQISSLSKSLTWVYKKSYLLYIYRCGIRRYVISVVCSYGLSSK